MKFGTYLHDNLIPEWESKYLNYSVIKKCIQDTKKLYKQQLQDGEGFPDASLRFNAETLCLELSPAQHIAQEAFQLIENDLNKILEFFSDQCENFVNRTTELGGKVKLFNSSQTRLLEKLKHEAAIARRSSSRSAANFNEAGEILPIAFVKSSSQIMSEKVQKFPRGRRGSAIDLTDLRKHKKNLKTVKKAFIEAYRCWVYLDNYRGLNETAARKIVKKFDKVFGLNIKEMYMSLITREYMFQSKTIIQVMEMMEDVWVTLLSNAPTRHLAMTQLREVHLISIQQQSAFQIFTLGFWMGIIVMLVLVPLMYSIDIEHFSDLSFGAPLVAIRCFGTGTYLTWCWAFDALIWERCRINFGYIFQLPFGIGSVQLFQAAALMSSVFLWFLIVLSTPTNTTVTDMTRHSWTGTFFVVVFVLLVNPFPLFNFRLRKWLLSTVRNCVRAGTVAVRFKDFWLADQFTSIAIIFADIPLLLCYFISNWTGNHDTCASVQYWQRPLFSSIPFWIRYFQCLKKSRDDKNPVQLYNSFKYLASVSVIATAAVHAQVQQIWSQVLWLLCASLSFCFSMYWDTYRDWGFFRHKTNLWPLRSGLKYAEHGLPKQMYFVAIACNAVMRLLWICVASQPELRSKYWWSLVASAIEVSRRGLWNLLRLEYEHTNNAENYRAVKDVPVPQMNDQLVEAHLLTIHVPSDAEDEDEHKKMKSPHDEQLYSARTARLRESLHEIENDAVNHSKISIVREEECGNEERDAAEEGVEAEHSSLELQEIVPDDSIRTAPEKHISIQIDVSENDSKPASGTISEQLLPDDQNSFFEYQNTQIHINRENPTILDFQGRKAEDDGYAFS